MDESHTGIRIQQHLHAEADLVIALCGEALHHDRHRPRHVVTDVWTTDTFASLATEEARIVLTPNETAGVLVDRIVHRNITHISHTQKRRNVGVVHQELVAETIYLVSIDLAILRMVVDSILLQSSMYLIGKTAAILRNLQGCIFLCSILLCHVLQNLCCLVHGRNCHEVGWNQEWKDGGIIRRTEHRCNQSYWFYRSTEAVPTDGIEGTVRNTGKVISLGCHLALLLVEGLQDILDSLHPYFAENRVIACYLPVLVSQTDRVAEGVDLIFALEYIRLHLGAVFLPAGTGRTVIEGIGVAVDVDALQLAENHTLQHLLQFFVLVGEGYVRPYLGT